MIEQFPEDFVDLVACLRAEGADFLIVGVHVSARRTGLFGRAARRVAGRMSREAL